MKYGTLFSVRLAGLLLAMGLGTSAAGAAQSSTTCDRPCLSGHITQVLYAFVKHDVSKLPVAANLRVTEDADEKKLDATNAMRYITGLRGYRQEFLDEREGIAGAHVMVEESGAPVMLVVRLKIVANQITEMELVATHSRTEGLIFNLEHLQAASEGMNYVPRPEQLNSRAEIIAAALKYPEGLAKAETFAAVNAPFADDAYRFENGQLMAGPGCTFNPGCSDIDQQSLTIFKRLGAPIYRIAAVDERMGVVWLRLAWGVQREGGDQLTAFEAFKVYDGKLHAVEAFIRILPIEKRDGGWKQGL
jgi:hypothetical protein